MANQIEVTKARDIEPGEGILVEIEGKELALFNCDGEYYAIDNECTHQGGPLCDGELIVDENVVVCPWHGAEFNIISGECLMPPADSDVKSYKVQVEGDSIKIEL